jgi:hypothetical protein
MRTQPPHEFEVQSDVIAELVRVMSDRAASNTLEAMQATSG